MWRTLTVTHVCMYAYMHADKQKIKKIKMICWEIKINNCPLGFGYTLLKEYPLCFFFFRLETRDICLAEGK